MPNWIEDVANAGYAGLATFESELIRFTDETDFISRIKDKGLALASVDWIIGEDMDSLRRLCDRMRQLECKNLVCLAGLSIRDSGLTIHQLAERLNSAGEVTNEFEIRTCYHHHTNQLGETMEETEQLLHLTDPTLIDGFVDTGHATKDFKDHPVEQRARIFIERNWDRINFIEFKDWSEDTKLCTEVGTGLCDFKSVFNIIKEREYEGWITVEQNGTIDKKLPVESAKASFEFIRKGLDL